VEGPVADDFIEAGRWLAELAADIPKDRLDDPGLDDWSIRSLLGHAARALVTVIEYLGRPADAVALSTAVTYLAAAGLASPEAIAQRGVAAGGELGEDPAASVAFLADESAELVRAMPADRLVSTIAGGMRLEDYLPTRTLELVIHGLDLANAIGSSAVPPDGPARSTLELLVELQVGQGRSPALIRSLAGRSSVPGAWELWPSPEEGS
jgi:uncharacterized protein (TIGR03083 family)